MKVFFEGVVKEVPLKGVKKNGMEFFLKTVVPRFKIRLAKKNCQGFKIIYDSREISEEDLKNLDNSVCLIVVEATPDWDKEKSPEKVFQELISLYNIVITVDGPQVGSTEKAAIGEIVEQINTNLEQLKIGTSSQPPEPKIEKSSAEKWAEERIEHLDHLFRRHPNDEITYDPIVFRSWKNDEIKARLEKSTRRNGANVGSSRFFLQLKQFPSNIFYPKDEDHATRLKFLIEARQTYERMYPEDAVTEENTGNK